MPPFIRLTLSLNLVCIAAPRTSMVQNYALQGIIPKQPAMVDVSGELTRRKERRLRLSFRVTASLDATAAAKVGQVTEVTKDTFWPIVKAAGDKTVVLDMYTQYCGPCKIIAPKFKKLSEKYDDVVFLKLDCSSDNRPLAKELGIKVVPTFKIFKDNKFVKEVTGAKLDDLVVAIESARSV